MRKGCELFEPSIIFASIGGDYFLRKHYNCGVLENSSRHKGKSYIHSQHGEKRDVGRLYIYTARIDINHHHRESNGCTSRLFNVWFQLAHPLNDPVFPFWHPLVDGAAAYTAQHDPPQRRIDKGWHYF